MNRGFLVAGTHSGCGKTTVALGIMAALRDRGLRVQPFKCGPDFIDPTLHHLVTGRVSRNLDLWMCGEQWTRACFGDHARRADISVVEGVMGFFDGGESSAATLAATLGLPVVLVVDARATAESMAAVVHGFESLEPELPLAGVILNRVAGERHLELLRGAVGRFCRTPVLGYLPREVDFAVPERHLGLHMGDEAPLDDAALASLAAAVAAHVDLDRLARLEVPDVPAGLLEDSPVPAERDRAVSGVRIGVARDRAFCFYYEDNLDLLRRAGADLVEFSPLADARLPDNLQGLYLGGGYPELYASELAANGSMREDIRCWSEAGGPVYAECGGFMYLTRGIVGQDGFLHPMVGIYPVRARMKQGRAALGYRRVRLTAAGMFGPAGTTLRGHEFHYSEIDAMPDSVGRLYELADDRCEGYRIRNTLGGYVHLHFGCRPEAVARFVRFCAGERG